MWLEIRMQNEEQGRMWLSLLENRSYTRASIKANAVSRICDGRVEARFNRDIWPYWLAVKMQERLQAVLMKTVQCHTADELVLPAYGSCGDAARSASCREIVATRCSSTLGICLRNSDSVADRQYDIDDS